MVAFENIVLPQNEEQILRDMLDNEYRDLSVQGVSHLHELGLANMAQQFPDKTNGYTYKMQFVISQTGKDYLRYLDEKHGEKSGSNRRDHIMDIITIIGVVASVIAAIASVIAALK